jgi:hypothetical protein
MPRKVIVLHSPLSLVEFEARFRERVDPDDWWLHGPLVWFSKKSVLGQIDNDSFTLRRPATYSRRRVPLLMFQGQMSADPMGGTRIEGQFELHPLQVLLSRILGIGGALFAAFEIIGMWGELRSGTAPLTDLWLEILVPLVLVAYGIFAPAIARLFAAGTESFLLDFMRKNLLAQADQAQDIPILDSAMR